MQNTLDHIKEKYNISYEDPSPHILNRVGRHSGIKELFLELGFTVGAEIGTKEGAYAKELCIALPNLKLYCIDPWKAYAGYQENWAKDQAMLDALYLKVQQKLKGYNCEIIRKTSMEGVLDFRPDSLDFVFIDANHEYDYVLKDISEWSKIVKPGGIVFGHDYSPDHSGVIQAVQDYTHINKINHWFILHAGGNNVDCWMFVKTTPVKVQSFDIYRANPLI